MKDKERRGGVNDRRDHREMCITEEVLRQKRSSKDVTSHGCRSAGMRTDFFIARNSCHVA